MKVEELGTRMTNGLCHGSKTWEPPSWRWRPLFVSTSNKLIFCSKKSASELCGLGGGYTSVATSNLCCYRDHENPDLHCYYEVDSVSRIDKSLGLF